MRTQSTAEDLYPDPDGSVLRQIQELEQMTVKQLQAKHLELYGFATRSKHKRQLFKRLSWRVQELKWGGVPQDVLDYLRSIEDDRDARFLPPRVAKARPEDPRVRVSVPCKTRPTVPPAGTILEREFGGEIHRVTVLDDGVEYRGRRYRSLSGVAREITGTTWNGKRFFGLVDDKGARR